MEDNPLPMDEKCPPRIGLWKDALPFPSEDYLTSTYSESTEVCEVPFIIFKVETRS